MQVWASVVCDVQLPFAGFDYYAFLACEIQVQVGIEDRFLVRAGFDQYLPIRRDYLAAANEAAAPLNPHPVCSHYVHPVFPRAGTGYEVPAALRPLRPLGWASDDVRSFKPQYAGRFGAADVLASKASLPSK